MMSEERKRLKEVAINNAISYWINKGNKKHIEYFENLKSKCK
tara:strand:+ start:1526 stop:1651 length:126 start_codon:yes stop_codon:yes gene_type:complete